MSASEERPPRAAGTRTMLDILKGRSPTPAAKAADLSAISGGEGREVSCFLRGRTPYPKKWRQGTLTLSAAGATWRPFWARGLAPIEIHLPLILVTTRPVSWRDWNIKRGLFDIAVCEDTDGKVEFAVPRPDMSLLRDFLSRAT